MKIIDRSGPGLRTGPRRAGIAGRSWKAAALALAAIFLLVPSYLGAGIEKVDGGIKFTYYDPDAGQVNLAGTLNGWNTDANPMTKDKDGFWSTVLKLDPGEYEYKFVVDGAWITDPENPSTKPDPYGGANSLLVLDHSGDIIVTAAETPKSNTPLNALVHIGGRYNMRAYSFKNIEDDPRWRMQRPEQNVDLNFKVTISEIVKGYFRLRVDSQQDLLQPNNVSAFMEEASIKVSPTDFTITGYHNMEVLDSGDPLSYIGDIDLPGTIFDDHLDAGKGTSGLVITTTQAGIDFRAQAANVHDYDIYNSPDLFDNTGTDIFSFRASKKLKKRIEIGIDAFARRNLWWLDFTSLIGSTPSNTGLPSLDEYLDSSDDPSDYFELEDKTWYAGADLSLDLFDGQLVPKVEYLQGKFKQGFVTGNSAGLDLGNGPIDVDLLERDVRIIFAGIRNNMIDNLMINFEHSRYMHRNAWLNESYIIPAFMPEEVANKRIFFTASSNPVDYTFDYSELELRWTNDDIDARLWFERNLTHYESRLEEGSDIWYYTWSVAPGLKMSPLKRFEFELEAKYTYLDGGYSPDLSGVNMFESIVRGDYSLTSKLSAIFDVRVIRYDIFDAFEEEFTETFASPFAGFEYRPMHKVKVTLAYGIDPLDFSIDYNGRHTGRYNFRNSYLWEHPEATVTDAEKALQDRRAFVLRAIFNF